MTARQIGGRTLFGVRRKGHAMADTSSIIRMCRAGRMPDDAPKGDWQRICSPATKDR